MKAVEYGNLKNLFDEYYLNTEDGQSFVEKFPEFYASMKDIIIVPWDKDLETTYDRNPEIIQTFEYVNMLEKNGLIDSQTAESMLERELKRLGNNYSAVVKGVAYIDEGTVAFRSDNVPSLDVLLHEAGHIRFKVNDLLWSSAYGGGEDMMWSIIKNRIETPEGKAEDMVVVYIQLKKLLEENPQKLQDILNVMAKEFGRHLKVDYVYNAKSLMFAAGTLSNDMLEEVREFNGEFFSDTMGKQTMDSFLINMLEGIRWKDGWWTAAAEYMFTERLEDLKLMVSLAQYNNTDFRPER